MHHGVVIQHENATIVARANHEEDRHCRGEAFAREIPLIALPATATFPINNKSLANASPLRPNMHRLRSLTPIDALLCLGRAMLILLIRIDRWLA
jgi:hypothetical protein